MEIKSVTLQTTNIPEMKKFYVESFGFSLLSEEENSFKIAVGSSELKFTSDAVVGSPYYHFAFNIPSNKFNEAKSWVKEKVELTTEDGDDEAHFSFMDAYAFYFTDPAGNIVEFISRSTSEKQEEPFSINSVINISEIGLTVENAISVGNKLIAKGINVRINEPFSTTSLNFMGDSEKGIFIILNQPGRRWIFSDKLSAIYPIEIITSNYIRIKVSSDQKLDIYDSVHQ